MRKFWSLSDFKGKCSLRSWIYRIATNEALRLLHQRQNDNVALDDSQVELNSMVADEYVDYSDLETVRLQKAIQTLPTKQQLAFNFRYYNELGYDEITGLTPESVKSNYHIAKEKRPELDATTNTLLHQYQKNPTEEKKQALLEQMGLRYDKVVTRKKSKLRELEREAKTPNLEEEISMNSGHVEHGLTAVDAYSQTTGACGGIYFWGNCWEWTSSIDANGLYIVKGGSWDSERDDCRSEKSDIVRTGTQGYANVGFRVVRNDLN